MQQLSIFAKTETIHYDKYVIGGIYENKLPCPQRMFADWYEDHGLMLGCYNNYAKVEIVSLISNDRAICKNIRLLPHTNHDGWTIVPLKFLVHGEDDWLYDDEEDWI